MAYKMKGFSGYQNSPMKQKALKSELKIVEEIPDSTKAQKKNKLESRIAYILEKKHAENRPLTSQEKSDIAELRTELGKLKTQDE